MQTPVLSIVYFLIASALGAVGQFLYKSGAETSGGSLASKGVDGSVQSIGRDYDAWNRLVTLNEGLYDVQVNEYDGLHRRIVRDETGGSGDERHFYYNQKWQCIEERQGSETTPHKQYVYHPYYIDAVACMWYDANDDGSIHDTDERYHFLHDANFNVVAVTDAEYGTFNVLERYHYTPYGEVTILNGASDADGSEWTEDTNGSDIENEFLYTGRRLDPETGLYQYRHRYYHAQLGRFVTRDPIGYDAGGYNLYEYADSSILQHLDPSGLSSIHAWIGRCMQIPPYPEWLRRKRCDCICVVIPGVPEKVCKQKCNDCLPKNPRDFLKDPAKACLCVCKIAAGENKRKLDQCEKACGQYVDCLNKLIDRSLSPKEYCRCVCNLLPPHLPQGTKERCLRKCDGLTCVNQ